ncbi:MAG: hydratase, partial [Burkholderiales bacterium]
MPDELTAAALLEACDGARSLDRSRFEPLTDLARAEALQAGIAIARIARGERQVGYKIGFTNRSIWPLYNVFHPIWAPVWTATLRNADAGGCARVAAAQFVEPRLEPEIVVGLRETPGADTPQAVLAATEWIAHGFEIVQSPFPDWRFSAAEAFAAQGLHGMLILGPRRPVAMLGEAPAQAIARLGELEVELSCDGRLVERGRGADVLDGPMHAIAHLSREMRLRGRSIEPGSLISTGTLTDAQPLQPGQRWQTR